MPGVRVGHAQRTGDGWLTGVTVVLPPPGTVAGVDVRGGGPGTHETDALDPRTLVPTADAVVLTGGSAYGLVTAHGVQRWLAEHDRGYRVGRRGARSCRSCRRPRCSTWGAAGGSTRTRTSRWATRRRWPRGRARRARTSSGVRRGGHRGGHRDAAAQGRGPAGRAPAPLDHVVVGALAVVNAAGAPVGAPWPDAPVPPGEPATSTGAPLNTTIAVVATNAALDPAETSRTATAAHAGLARALDPVHTLVDGDTVFALATGAAPLPAGPAERASRVGALVQVQAAAARALELAVIDGIRSAQGVRTPRVDLPAWDGPLPTMGA
nr:P1 family peptidase [Cellulomonas endometrii]